MIVKFLRRLTGADKIPYLHEQIDLLRGEVDGLHARLDRVQNELHHLSNAGKPNSFIPREIAASKYGSERVYSGTQPVSKEERDRYREHVEKAFADIEMGPGAIQNRKILEDPAVRAFWQDRIREHVRAYEKVYGNATLGERG